MPRMIQVTELDPALAVSLPEMPRWLSSVGLAVHSSVVQITLHGSRGLAQNYRPDSDIDISLLVPFSSPPAIGRELEKTLREVAEVTSTSWNSSLSLDLAVIFPRKRCSFACFQRTSYDAQACPIGGVAALVSSRATGNTCLSSFFTRM